jgi:hypothetical protein
MADLNIRNIGTALRRDVRKAAIDAGLTLREYVCYTLAQAVAGSEDRLDVRLGEGLAGAPPAANLVTHGPLGTCRVYRCGQCMALGKVS